jgi:hypothetical protein
MLVGSAEPASSNSPSTIVSLVIKFTPKRED